MSRSLGASADETSRLIQVSDDVRVSYETLQIAMKEAQKNGIDPSIDGLARLSDQYLALAPGVERTQFLLDKFGKSGLEMGKLMEKGGEGIRSASKAVSENLIMTEEGIQKTDDYQMKLDDLSDSWDGLSMAVGGVALEPVTNALENINSILVQGSKVFQDAGKAIEDFTEKNKTAGKVLTGLWGFLKDMNPILHLFDDNSQDATQSTDEFSGVLETNASALYDNKEAIKNAEGALNDYKDMLKEVSAANQEAESFLQSYADSQKDYEKSHAEAAASLQEAIRSGDKESISEAQKGIQELEASWHESTNKMIYDMALAKVSVDGLTDAEFAATQDLAVQMGLRTQAQADEAKAMMEKATSIADGIAMQEDVMREKAAQDAELLRLENEKALAAGNTTTAIVDGSGQSVEALGGVAQAVDSATQSYIAMAAAAWDASAAAQAANGASSSSTSGSSTPESVMHSRDSGGQGIAGTPYLIGMGAQPEVFVPSSNGNFIPNADKKFGGSKTINISISNPKGETSENSIRRSLKQVSYLGYAI